MTRRPFNRTAFLAGYRQACIEADIDPLTGNPRANDDPRWWARDPAMWENGPNASSVEAAALASIAAQVRAIYHVAEPAMTIVSPLDKLTDRLVDAVNMVVNVDRIDQYTEEVRDDPTALHDLSLREQHWHEYIGYYNPADLPLPLLHQMRGVEVIDLEGLRIEVPVKTAKGWDKWEAYKQSLRRKIA